MTGIKAKRVYNVVLITVFLQFVAGAVWAQLKPFNPKKLAELERKLAKTEIKTEKATLYLDLHDQWMYVNSNNAYFYNNQALNLARELRDKLLLARAYGNKGNEFFDEGDLKSSLQYYLKSSELISEKEQPLLMALNLSNISNVFSLKGDYPTSMEYAYRSIALSKKSPEGLNLTCHTRANLAGTYTSLEQYKKAEFLLIKTLNEIKTYPSPTVKAMAYTYLGMNYSKEHKIKTAIHYQKLALQETEPFGLDYFTSRACYSLGNLYLSNKEPQKALYFERRAKVLSTLSEDAQIQIVSNAGIANTFLDLGKLDSASFYAEQALSIAQQKGIKSSQPWILQIHSKILKERKQYDASLKALQESRRIGAQVFSQEAKDQSINRLEAFSTLETREDLDLKYAHQFSRVKIFRNISIIAVVLALIVGFGIYFLYRYRKILNLELTKKNEELETNRKEVFQMNQIKDQLFAAIAHELRTPLHTIQEVLSKLDQNSKSPDFSSESNMLTQLQHQTVGTITLMEDLLFTARVQMQMYHPLRQEFQLKSLTDELDKNLKLLNNGTFLTIIHAIPKDLYLYSDMTMLKMAMRNLFLNVANRPGKIMFPVVLSAWKENGLVYIRIADVQEFEQPITKCNAQQCNDSPRKPYWDISLIQNFLEANGGKLSICPYGKGYDIILPDPHQS
jgi:hypothetical protein